MITVLFICSERQLDGAALSLLDLIQSVTEGVKPVVFCMDDGIVYNTFISHGIESYVCAHSLVYGYRRSWRHYVAHPWHIWNIKLFRQVQAAIKMVKKELPDGHVDIVHTNVSATLLGHYISKALKVKHVWHIREYLEKGRHAKGIFFVTTPCLQRLMNKANARIVASSPCLRHWGLKKENTWVIWDAVRSVNDCIYVKEKQPYVLFCSHWVNEAKGANKIIAAFGMSGLFDTTRNNEVFRLKIVGVCEENYKIELMTLAESYGCAEYIDFIPEQKDVKPFFANAMAYVNPSVNEGMGRTTAEAMFFGCPVIAHASGGTLDLVKDGRTGYLFNTIDECSELMRKVCTTDQEEVILRAQEFVKQNLSVENYGRKVMEVYNSVLKTR
jgi:glycosyltransferase involved in cell wall biosynthesis